jgi:hypothetical protein
MHRGRLLAAGSLAELWAGKRAGARIHVVVEPCTTAQVLAALGPDVRCVASTDRTLTIDVAPEAKMCTLRALAQCGERVRDVEIAMPGLQALYAQLTGAAEQRA